MTTYITPELFAFFRELKQNNNRDWFQANKQRYEKQVREPLLDFIVDFGVRLPEISRHYVADARKSGGSLFRIYRDVRFSKDKTPYKTGAGVQFRHEAAKDVHAPGFYLHIEPGACFIGAGAVVTRDVPPYALVVGNPGRQVGWMSEYGHRLDFDKQGRAACPESGDKYELSGESVSKIG